MTVLFSGMTKFAVKVSKSFSFSTRECKTPALIQTAIDHKSCNDIYKINKASRGVFDNYSITTTTGVHQVYCDMELECGGHKKGWMRIADLDIPAGEMTLPQDGLRLLL